jgi:hypothetical protein
MSLGCWRIGSSRRGGKGLEPRWLSRSLPNSTRRRRTSTKVVPRPTFKLNLSKLATRELESTFEQAFRGDPSINPPKRQTSVGDLNFMGVESGTVLALAKVLGLLGD